MEWEDIQQALQASIKSAEAYLVSPWFYMQAGIILVAAGLSLAFASFLRARINPTSLAMGLPGPLRALIRVLMSRIGTIIFALLIAMARAIIVKTEVLRHGYLLSTAASLATAWVIIRLATGLIRNEFVVRAVSVAAWIIAALSIIGKLDDVSAALDSVSIPLGTLRVTPLLVLKVAVSLGIALWLVNMLGNFFESRISARADPVGSSAPDQNGPPAADGGRICSGDECRRDRSVRLRAVFRRHRRRPRLRPANDRRQFHQRRDPAGGQIGEAGRSDHHRRQFGKNQRDEYGYISVAAGDGREILIPNEDLVTQRVVNWTYTNKNMLVKVNFATNYDADPSLVCKLAIDIASKAANVATFKAPNCLLTEFAETGMKFSLTFWVADLDVGADNVRSDVMLKLWNAFKTENIRVPYPVREIRVRGGALPVESVIDVPS